MAKKKQAREPKLSSEAAAIEKADVAVARTFLPLQDNPAVRAASWIASVGDQPPLQALSWTLLASGLVSGNRRLARAGGRMVLAHLAATAAKNFVKHRVDRTRPHVLTERAYKMKKGKGREKEVTSFPSGHTAGAVAAAFAFAREYPEYAAAAHSAAGAVAIAQIPRCAHYPSDVGAGAAIGFASERFSDFLIDQLFPEAAS
jgi:membrane-associated phospholipid phosphatase